MFNATINFFLLTTFLWHCLHNNVLAIYGRHDVDSKAYTSMARNEGVFDNESYPNFSCVGCLRSKKDGTFVGTACLIKNPFIRNEEQTGFQWVLTDAHVIYADDQNLEELEFVLCTNLLDESTVIAKRSLKNVAFFELLEAFKESFFSEDYPFQCVDLALVMLQSPVTINHKKFKPIELEFVSEKVLKNNILGHKSYISGFGYTGDSLTHQRVYHPCKRSAEVSVHKYIAPFKKNLGLLACTFLSPDGSINLSNTDFDEMVFEEKICDDKTSIENFQLLFEGKCVLKGKAKFSIEKDPFIILHETTSIEKRKIDFLLNKNNLTKKRSVCLAYEGSVMGGDSGGPLFYLDKTGNWKCIGLALAGIPPSVSYGNYQFFTPITEKVLDWIKKATLECLND